jgi:hypothetical protein
MIPNELMEYYESLVKGQGPSPGEDNQHLRAYVVEIRDLWEKRVILRELRYRSGMKVCSGEVDCVETPTTVCMHGTHPTCPKHTDDCFLRVPIASLSRMTR